MEYLGELLEFEVIYHPNSQQKILSQKEINDIGRLLSDKFILNFIGTKKSDYEINMLYTFDGAFSPDGDISCNAETEKFHAHIIIKCDGYPLNSKINIIKILSMLMSDLISYFFISLNRIINSTVWLYN